MANAIRSLCGKLHTWFNAPYAATIKLGLLALLCPILLGDWTSLARAGDSMAMPIHYFVGFGALFIIWVGFQVSMNWGISLMLVYASIFGGIRRMLIPLTGYINNDPMTLVGVIFSILLFLRLALTRQIPSNSIITKLMTYLLLMMGLAILNPLQGGFQVGVGGIIFYIVPVCWFFIGSAFGDRKLIDILVNVYIVICLLAGVNGLYQVAVGFADSEIYWSFVSGGTQSVSINALRPFGFSTSFAEYVYILGTGCCLCWAKVISKKYAYIVPFLFLFACTFLSSSRGGVFSILFTIVLLWAIQGRQYGSWWPRLFLAAIVAGVSITIGTEQVKDVGFNNASQDLLAHQIKGLNDPFGKQATGVGHLSLISQGIMTGFRTPMGYGLGAGTLASAKFGDSVAQHGTEFDISNVFVSLGFVGGFLYIAIIVNVWRRIMTHWHDTRDTQTLAVIATMALTFGHWLTGEHYSNTMFLWVTLGSLDRVLALEVRRRASETND